MKYYFINHGFMGSNIENWFPWFKNQIDSETKKCIIPQYPIDEEHHFYNDWKSVLNIYKKFNMINDDTIIIGHSTGSIFSVKYILESKVKVNKLILISGFNNYLSPDKDDLHNKINPTYYISDEELKIVKQYANEIICIYENDDPYIPQNVLHDFSVLLDAKEIVINNGGHLNEQAGYTTFDEILKVIS